MTQQVKITPPTIGSPVWYWRSLFNKENGLQPEAATVVFVHNDRCVNLVVLDALGDNRPIHSVVLRQPEDSPPTDRDSFCEWMPYQQQQHAKNQQETVPASTAPPPAPAVSGVTFQAYDKLRERVTKLEAIGVMPIEEWAAMKNRLQAIEDKLWPKTATDTASK